MGKFYVLCILFNFVFLVGKNANAQYPYVAPKTISDLQVDNLVGGNVAAFTRKWLIGSPCNPTKDLSEGDCDMFWFCKPSLNVTTSVGTWILNTCNIDAPTRLGNLFWNPNGPFSVHGGTCDWWENLSNERRNMYFNDPECFKDQQCKYEAYGWCPTNYLEMHPIETLGKYVQKSCTGPSGQLYFDKKSHRCVPCNMVMSEPNGKVDCCKVQLNHPSSGTMNYGPTFDGPFPRKMPEAGPCNPEVRIPDGNCRDYWFCKEVVTPNNKATGVKEGAWMFNTCSEADQVPGVYWNPDGPFEGKCTTWDELSSAVQALYHNSCLLYQGPTIFKESGCHSVNYTYTQSDKPNEVQIELECPKDASGYKKLLWDPYVKTCLPCYKHSVWSNSYGACEECSVPSTYQGRPTRALMSWANWDESSRPILKLSSMSGII